jgi:hypothetical protein
MYTAKSIGKSVKDGALHITVEYTDDKGKPTFSETYWANSGTDPYWLQNRVNNKLHELNTLMVLHDQFVLGDIPSGYGKPPASEEELYLPDLNKLKNMKRAISTGLLNETDPEYLAQLKKVKDSFKPKFLTTIII